jgi:hypothetical protein
MSGCEYSAWLAYSHEEPRHELQKLVKCPRAIAPLFLTQRDFCLFLCFFLLACCCVARLMMIVVGFPSALASALLTLGCPPEYPSLVQGERESSTLAEREGGRKVVTLHHFIVTLLADNE